MKVWNLLQWHWDWNTNKSSLNWGQTLKNVQSPFMVPALFFVGCEKNICSNKWSNLWFRRFKDQSFYSSIKFWVLKAKRQWILSVFFMDVFEELTETLMPSSPSLSPSCLPCLSVRVFLFVLVFFFICQSQQPYSSHTHTHPLLITSPWRSTLPCLHLLLLSGCPSSGKTEEETESDRSLL